MKKYMITAVFGAALTAIVFLVVYPQYGDYTANTQVSRVLYGVKPFLEDIQKEVIERNGFVGLSKYGIDDAEYIQRAFVDTLEVTDSGVVIIVVQHEKPIIVLSPSFDGEYVYWSCIAPFYVLPKVDSDETRWCG
jgi:hypothetical protein